MCDVPLHFSPLSTEENATFKLLELPPELVSLLESSLEKSEPLDLVIKGDPTEDAVLCTRDKTYSIRAVNLSNTLLVVTPPPDTALDFADNAVVIRDQVNEILEVAPAVPKIAKLVALLRGREYDETNEDEDEEETADTPPYTYARARQDIQASDAELDNCLKQKRILIIKDELRPISIPYLNTILELILTTLISDSLSHSACPIETLTSALAGGHGVSPTISRQVLKWFGTILASKKSIWEMDVDEVVKELGLGILREYPRSAPEPVEKEAFMKRWKEKTGDTFMEKAELKLLAGNYLETKFGTRQQESLTYFPASALPSDPAARFSDLFLTRTRWKVDDITPFLSDIAINNKERDKLLLKYCRAVNEAGVVWYAARAQYNG